MKKDVLNTRKLEKREIEAGHNGDGEKEKPKKPLLRSQVESAFHAPRQTTAIDFLVQRGEYIQDLLMRANFKDAPSEGSRLNRAFQHHIAKAIEAGDEAAIEEAFNVIAGDVAVNGDRISQLVQAIIGGNPKEIGHGKGGWEKKTQEMAFGKKNPNTQPEFEG